MGRLRTIARRTFLIGSTAVLGGVAFGAYMVARPSDNPLVADAGDGDAVFNPWVKITKDEIMLVVPHADKGQGVASSQAMLIAEELDVEMDQVTLTFGEPSGAYTTRPLRTRVCRSCRMTTAPWPRSCGKLWAA